MNDLIRRMRIDAGMHQQELGKKLGMSQSAVSKFESEGYDYFSICTLKKIAKIFDVNFVAYLEEKKPSEPINLISDED